jgi:Glycosyl transferase family group 2
MIIIVVFLIIFYFFYGLSFIVNIKKILKLLEKKPHKSSEIQIILLLPVLYEQKIIRKTLKYLSRINYNYTKLRIIVITTEKENRHNQNPTAEIVKEMLPQLNKKMGTTVFAHLHFPKTTGVKSDQLNYAIKIIRGKEPTLLQKNTYIGVYDADSRSNLNTLKILSAKAKIDKFPFAYQQPMAYTLNYNSLPNSLDGFIMKGFALFQTRYSLGYEASLFIKNNNNKMVYCMGHGLFIRADFLLKIGLFPSPIEDTRFGHICSFLKVKVHLLPSLAVTEVTNKISKLIEQTSVWFIGQNYLLKDLSIAKHIKKLSILNWLPPLIHRIFRNTIWFLENIIIIASIILAYIIDSWILSSVLLLGIFFYVYLPSFYIIKKSEIIKKLSSGTSCKINGHLLDFFSIIFASLLCSIGPQLGIIKLIKERLTGKVSLPKTER